MKLSNFLMLAWATVVILLSSYTNAQEPIATDAASKPDASSAPIASEVESNVSFVAEVAPILRDHCLACHGPKKAEGGYRVDSYTELLKPGDSGAAPFSTDQDDSHELLRRLTTDDSYERMPAEAERLSDSAIGVFQRWLAQGAKFDGDDPKRDLLAIIPASQFPEPPVTYPPVPVTALTFSADGKFLVGSGYYELLVWNVEHPGPPRRISNIDQRTLALAWLPENLAMAVACGQPGHSGEVRLVDFRNGQVIASSARMSDTVLDVAVQPSTVTVQIDQGSSVEQQAGSPETLDVRPLLAVANADGTVRLLDSADLTEKRMFASHADWVTSIAWAPDGKSLISASKDKSVKVYDLETGQLKVNYQGHTAGVRGVTFTPDGLNVISIGADKRLLRWKSENGEKVAELGLPGEPLNLNAIALSLLVPCANHNLLRIDTTNNSVSQSFVGHQDWVTASAYHEATGRYASGSVDGEIRLWNASDGTLLRHWFCQP